MRLSNYKKEEFNMFIDHTVKYIKENEIKDFAIMRKISRNQTSPFSSICKAYLGEIDYNTVLRIRTMWIRNQQGKAL
jgi:hypothetical protein